MSMRARNILLSLLVGIISLRGHGQTAPPSAHVPILAFKLLMRSTQPFFAPDEPLNLEVACVSIPEIASAEWQERWSNACANAKLEIEEARIGSYLGGVGTMAWLWNRLFLCLGESYAPESHLAYTQPKWRLITLPKKRRSGLRGMVRIDAHAVVNDGQRVLYDEHAQVITAIVSGVGDDTEAGLSSEIQEKSSSWQTNCLNLLPRAPLR